MLWQLPMTLMRCALIAVGLILTVFAAAAVYTACCRPSVGPEAIAHATMAVLIAIVCFVGSAKLTQKKL